MARDVAAVVLLVAATLYLAADDGGRPVQRLLPVAVVGLALSPLLVVELGRLRRTAIVVVSGLGAGPAVAWLFAPYRSGAARPLLVAAIAVLAFLAVRYLWRRPWGPVAVLAAVGVAVGERWAEAAFAWWGSTMGGASPTWFALSWHNQSGTLMGTAGVAALALALVGPARLRPSAMVAVGPAIAGAWLSGSRGALLATAVGIVVVAVGARWRGWREVASTLLVAAVLSAVATGGLLALAADGDGGQPLTTREQSAEHNLRARVGHAEAAVRMAVENPLVGTGPGSYRWASRAVYPGDTNLTASAHNEYLEAFGETGLAGGVPVAAAALALALLAVRVVRSPSRATSGRAAGVLAAAGAVAVLGVHAGADFDWDYGLLAVLLAAGGGVLHAARGHTSAGVDRAGGWVGGAAIGLGVAAAVGMGAVSLAASPAPWDLPSARGAAVAALVDGDRAGAGAALDRLGRWNAGSEALPVLRALADVREGHAGGEVVLASIQPRRTPHAAQLLAADILIVEGYLDAAATILDNLEPVLAERAAWGVDETRAGLERQRAALDAARARM